MTNSDRERRVRNFVPKPMVCPFCAGKVRIDYKDTSVLGNYISRYGKIERRRRSRACAKHQRSLAQAIKRARFLALLPYAPSHIWKTGGLNLR